MAGSGVSKLDVRVARNQLTAEGKHVSARTLREVLGHGSLSTILRHLKEIEAESGEAFGIGGMVHTELRDVVMNLHDRLQEMASATVTEAAVKADAKVAAAEEHLKAEQDAHAQTAGLLKETTNELNTLTRRFEELVQRFNEASVTIGRQEQKLESEHKIQQEHLGRIDKLEHDLDMSRSQFAHLQASTKSLMADTKKAHDEALTAVQRQVDHLTNKNFEYNSTISELNHANGVLVADTRTHTRELNACRESLDSVKNELSNAQSLLESLKLAGAAKEGQLTLLNQQLETARTHHIEAEDRSRVYANEAERLRSMVDDQQKQITALTVAAEQQAHKGD
ncbi:DNA-binding protein [Pseudomonas frederiksbergensis]